MFFCSSVGSLASHHTQRTINGSGDELATSTLLHPAPSSSSDDGSSADLSTGGGAPENPDHQSRSMNVQEDDYLDDLSYGGTIIASLSSREVAQNLRASMKSMNAAGATTLEDTPRMMHCTTQNLPAMEAPRFMHDAHLPETATVRSDTLSFTPTMAEHALSFHHDTVAMRANSATVSPQDRKEGAPTSFYQPISMDESPTPTIGGGEGNHESRMQPEFFITCPFCDREKDLQWRLTQEQVQSQDLKISEHRTRFFLGAIVAMVAVAVVSFFVGKTVSDRQSQAVLSQYMAQCSDMVSHRDEEELYWKLVTAAFSAMVHAMAGPLANVVLGGAVGQHGCIGWINISCTGSSYYFGIILCY